MPAIRTIVGWIQKFVDWLNSMDEGTRKVIVTIALVAAFIYLWNNCEEFRQFWIDLWESIKEIAIAVWEALKAFFQAAWEAIKTTATTVWNAIKDFFSGLWEGIKNIFTTVVNAISTFLSTAWNGIKTAITTVLNAIKTVGGLAKGIEKSRGMIENAMNGVTSDLTISDSKRTQATAFASLSEAEVIKRVGALFTEDQKKTGILASVSLVQFVLESGYGKSELAQNANNVFGMKCALSGNTWADSTWDGKSKYTKQTKEQNADGSYVTITADFRKYSCVEDSISDHSAYLLGAKNGSKLRYDGLKGCTDYKKAIQIIKDGGYATSLTYVEKLCSVIERWNLTQYDVTEEVVAWYRVRKTWEDSKS